MLIHCVGMPWANCTLAEKYKKSKKKFICGTHFQKQRTEIPKKFSPCGCILGFQTPPNRSAFFKSHEMQPWYSMRLFVSFFVL